MVRALLDGRKSQTRRTVKPIYDGDVVDIIEWRPQNGAWFGLSGYNQVAHCTCPYGEPGDRLWVKESYAFDRAYDALSPSNTPRSTRIAYAADGPLPSWAGKPRPSIYMPRWACRIALEITCVRVERLQDISVGDCCAEGAPIFDGDEEQTHAVQSWYQNLWQSINGVNSWAANPWVWVVEFVRIDS